MHWSDAVGNGITVTGAVTQVREHDGSQALVTPGIPASPSWYRLPMSLYLR